MIDPYPQDPLQRADISIAFIKDANGIVYTCFLAIGVHCGDWGTQLPREIDMLRHPKPATIAYFATRVFAFATLLSACIAVSIGGYSDTKAEGSLIAFFVFESCALSTVQAILLMRTLALWNNHLKVKYLSCFAWLASSAVQFIKLYAYAATANPLGIWVIFPSLPVGGKLRVVPYFISLVFATCMTILTLVGAQRQTVSRSTQELLRLQPGRGATKRREFIASRILRGQILYYVVMVFSTGSTALLLTFEALKGFNQFIPLVLNIVLTCSSACNIVLSMRSPIKGSLDVDHGLSLLPAGHHRVEVEVETEQVPGYAQTPELRSSSSPSLQKEAMRRGGSHLGDHSNDPESGSRSPEQEKHDRNLKPIEDPFWGRDEVEAAPFETDNRASAISASQLSPRTPDETGRAVAFVPHLGRDGSTSETPFQGGEELQDATGVHVMRDVVTRVEDEK